LEEKLNTPDALKYNKMDLWIKIEGEIATIGITEYAQDQLSDIVFAEVKSSVGETLERGKTVAVVESVKASSDISAPLTGKVLEINEEISSSPELMNSDPYGHGWLMKMQIGNQSELASLLDSKSYSEYRSK
jgi:glycine cleavage system H protein